jgi:hypothetical protein
VASKEDLALAIMARVDRTSVARESLVSPQEIVAEGSAGSARTLRNVSVGLELILLYEVAYLFVACRISEISSTVYVIILADIAITSVALAMTRTFWCARRWREFVFLEFSGMVISAVIISSLTAQPIECFLAAVLLQTGAAVLVPWGPRWQAALFTVCVCAITVGALLVPPAGASTQYLWIDLLAAAGLAQFVAVTTQRYRREVNGRYWPRFVSP